MNDTRLTVLGLFVVCATVVGLCTLVSFGHMQLFHRTRSAEIIFDGSVSGLTVGSPVTFRGVPIGRVARIGIEYDPRDRRAYIPVRITLEAGKLRISGDLTGRGQPISQWVAEGLRARLAPVNLISGESEINLDFDPSGPLLLHQRLGELPEIPLARESSQPFVQQLSGLPLEQLAANAARTLESIKRLADSLSVRMPAFLQSATRSSNRMRSLVDATQRAVVALQARMSITLTAIDGVAGSGERQIDGRGAELHQLLVSSNQAVLEAQAALRNLRNLTDDDSPDRMELEESLTDLSAASASLRGFAGDIEQNPRLLVTGRRR